MKRREFVALLGGAATASTVPQRLRAQQPKMPVVGYVRSTAAAGSAGLDAALRQGLKDAGFVAGQNVTIELHYAENRPERLSALIADLIHREAAVIVGNAITAFAAKAATTTVPILFVSGIDPVRDGLVASLNRPGGNITGVSFLVTTLGAKRLQLLHQLVPKASIIAALVHRDSPQAKSERNDLPAAAQAMGLRLLILDIDNEREVEAAFATATRSGAGALFVGGSGFLNSIRDPLIAAAARHALPASYPLREFAVAGGLTSYAPSITDAYRQVAIYAGRILKGERPADLPVMQSTKFEFVINLKTAKALGLELPPTLLALVDEVME